MDVDNRTVGRQAVEKRIMLRDLLAEVGYLTVFSLAVAAHHCTTRVVMIALISRNGLLIERECAVMGDSMRTPFSKKDKQEESRKKASQVVFPF